MELVGLSESIGEAARRGGRIKRRVATMRPRDFRSKTPLKESFDELKSLEGAGRKFARQCARLADETSEMGWAGVVAGVSEAADELRLFVQATRDLAHVQREKIRFGAFADVGGTRREAFGEVARRQKGLSTRLRRAGRLESLWVSTLAGLGRPGEVSDERPVRGAVESTLLAAWKGLERAHDVVAGRSLRTLIQRVDPELTRLDLRVVGGLLCEVRGLQAETDGSPASRQIALLAERCERVVEIAENFLTVYDSRRRRARGHAHYRGVIGQFLAAWAEAEEARRVVVAPPT